MAKALLHKIEHLRQRAKERGERFEALTEKELMNKITGKTSKSPYIWGQSWGSVVPGGSMTYTAYVNNPDPTGYSGTWLFGYLFFGPANFIVDRGLALNSIDDRFPHFLQECTVAAASDTTMSFTIEVPSTIRPGIYLGNCFLVYRDSFGVGDYFDRAAFDVNVV
jgi:hypothetical protein